MIRLNRCIICRAIIPEGRMVCPGCERATMFYLVGRQTSRLGPFPFAKMGLQTVNIKGDNQNEQYNK